MMVTVLGVALGAAAHGAEPQMLAEGSWVCATPEALDGAIASEHQGRIRRRWRSSCALTVSA